MVAVILPPTKVFESLNRYSYPESRMTDLPYRHISSPRMGSTLRSGRSP